MYPESVRGLDRRRYSSATRVLKYSPPRFSSRPRDTQASSRRSTATPFGRSPSKIPKLTAANMVFERLKASIKSRMGAGSVIVENDHIHAVRAGDLEIASRRAFRELFFRYATSRAALSCREAK